MQRLVDWFWRRRPGAIDASYKVFTRRFDREVTSDKLHRVLGRPSPRVAAGLDEAWESFQGALLGWRTRCELAALNAGAAVRATVSEEVRAGAVVAILMDQSGSMRGQKMLLAAAAADVTQDFIRQLGCKVEVLGFTTTSWRGGLSRRLWKSRFKPPNPGRLCDLLHVIYQSADDMRASGRGFGFKPMLRPDLPKENVDGEALEWAASRLLARPEKRKFLVVLSDGAPVDDATLSANGLDYLDRHLKEVVAHLESDPRLEVAAVGIGFDARDYYARAVSVQAIEDIGTSVITLVRDMLMGKAEGEDPQSPSAPSMG